MSRPHDTTGIDHSGLPPDVPIRTTRGGIFAHHAHVFPQFVNPDGTVDRLLRLMDACEIDDAVCFAPFPHHMVPHNVNTNVWLAREIEHRPRLHGFGTLDLRGDD